MLTKPLPQAQVAYHQWRFDLAYGAVEQARDRAPYPEYVKRLNALVAADKELTTWRRRYGL